MMPDMQPAMLTALAPYQTGPCCPPVAPNVVHVLESAIRHQADGPAILVAPGSLPMTVMQPELQASSSHHIQALQALPVQQQHQQQQCQWEEYVAVQSQDCSSLSALLLHCQQPMTSPTPGTEIGSTAVSTLLRTYSFSAVMQPSLEYGGQQQFSGQLQLPQLPLLPGCNLDTKSTAYRPTVPADRTFHTIIQQLISLRSDSMVEIRPGPADVHGLEQHNLGPSSSRPHVVPAAFCDSLQQAAAMTATAAAPRMAGNGPRLRSKRAKRAPHLHKTELCRNWQLAAWCAHGGACQFAHGELELRPKCKPASYKTQFCRAFYSNGKCSYGADCNFLHGAEDLACLVGVKDKDLRCLQLLSGQ